jgi:hypothetical protein
VARLFMQNPTTAQALLAGCWRIFEGQFFDIWDYPTMTIDRSEVGDIPQPNSKTPQSFLRYAPSSSLISNRSCFGFKLRQKSTAEQPECR